MPWRLSDGAIRSYDATLWLPAHCAIRRSKLDSRSFGLQDVQDAYALIENRQANGKLVVDIG